MKTTEKLEQELQSSKDPYGQIIGQYILGRFRALDLAPPPDKNLKDCLDKVRAKAQKQAHGNMAFVEDATVYRWAEEYYGLPAAETKGKQENAAAPGPKHLELDLEDLF